MSENDLATLRHSASHVMAHAVRNLFPGAKIAIGPSIEEGFYYDFDVKNAFTPEDIDKITVEMEKIISANSEFTRREITRDEALALFADEPFKIELINELLANAGEVKAFKLLRTSGAYWRGDERNKMLQRIYGTAFESADKLEAYLTLVEEAEKRDHRKLGKELDLFSLQEEAGPGLVFWHPKGALVRKMIEDYWRNEHLAGGYDLLYTPHIARQELWATSGHLDFFNENMYEPMEVEGSPYLIKPMNCPFHMLIYKSRVRSYRELPMRWAELGTVYRYERSGVLHGLLRVRGFTQDDAHILCTRDQLDNETRRVLEFVLKVLKRFGFSEFEVYLSTRPEHYVGTDDVWIEATDSLRASLDAVGLEYKIDEGGGAFYGPKIDIKIKDAIGRAWQCSTIQVDFNEPERFDITYVGQDNQQHRPIMIHRALLGSLERFMAVLVEHYAGAFPLWLAPVQAVVIPIADRHVDYARQVAGRLKANGLRVDVDDRNEKTGYKIREAQLHKIPYMLVVGDREAEAGEVSVRSRSDGDKGAVALDDLMADLKKELAEN